jgi:uncharacterized SAM-binding protein YcdF (DUF218 family)
VPTVLAFSVLLTDAPARWLVIDDPPAPVDAAVVLAGDPGYERTRTAVTLIRTGEARLLVLTGGEPGPGDSATSLRDYALALGVPADRIRLETVSHTTRESLIAVEPILRREGVRTIALVTSPFHQRRAYMAARSALPGIVIRNRPAQRSHWRPLGWWRQSGSRRIVASEYIKIVYYAGRGWL